jgi:5'(3')-deoxyribonucleotidase
MDEVMADTLAEHLRRYNQTFDEDVTPEDLAGKGLWEITPLDRQAQLRAFLDAEDFFEVLAVIPDAQPVLKDLSTRFEIFIATQAMAVPNSLGPKYRWLQRHFPFIPATHYVFCGNKTILRADFLIDDQPRNLARFEGQGLLYTAPRNRIRPREQLARSGRVFRRRSCLTPQLGFVQERIAVADSARLPGSVRK